MNRRGYATVEASVVTALFLFAMLALLQLGFVMVLQVRVYTAFSETVRTTAGQAYGRQQWTGGDSRLLLYTTVSTRLQKSCRQDGLAEQYIRGGSRGIRLTGVSITEDGFLDASLRYEIAVRLPMLAHLRLSVQEHIRQKMYTGYVEQDTPDTYVYITDYKSVYHCRRNCSHLVRKLSPVTREQAVGSGKGACRYCGKQEGKYYMTAYGDCYHRSAGCPGIARSIQRVKKQEVSGLGACSRCGNASD